PNIINSSPTRRLSDFESVFLHRRVYCEPDLVDQGQCHRTGRPGGYTNEFLLGNPPRCPRRCRTIAPLHSITSSARARRRRHGERSEENTSELQSLTFL